MRQDWQQFLEENGAAVVEGKVTDFGNPTRERKVVTSGSVIADLSHTGIIAAQGEDARQFLLNQFTNDVSQVSDALSQLNGYCNPKGRLLALFRLFMRHDVIHLQVHRGLMEPAMKRLRMFVLNAKVTLDDVSDSFVRIGFAGARAEDELRAVTDAVPEAPDRALTAGGVTIIRLGGIQPRFEILAEVDDMKKIWGRLNVNAAPVGAEAWELLDILAGLPDISPETSEEYVPQMVNLEAVNGLSFKKGCYPGQEIVARMQYLGKLKRRMYRIHIEDADVTPGSDVVDDSGNKVGALLRCARAQDNGYEALAVLEIAASDRPLHIGAADSPVIKMAELPYSVADRTKSE
jgi:folate-binding protein YgfZ